MAVGIPLPELDVTKPAQNAPPDALAEFQRASQLQTAAAQRDQMAAVTQGQQQQNQMQALALKDEQMRRSLAPQYVTKDDSGKVTGFDTDGLYNAMLQGGADPASIAQMRVKQVEYQKALLGLSDEKLAHQDKVNNTLFDTLESVRSAWKDADPTLGKGQAQGQPAQPANASGMPSYMLPNASAPGPPTQTPQAQAPAAVPPEAQKAYQQGLIKLSGQGIPVGAMKPVLTSYDDIDQAETALALHKQQLADAKEQASTSEAAGKGAQGQAEAEAALWKPAGEGTLVNVKSGAMVHGVAPPDTESFKAFIANGGSAAQWPAYKAQQEAAATQPFKIQTAEAEGRARQLIEGLGKSVYAFKPDGTHELMSQTAALQTPGVKAMVPATEKQIGDDIMLNNRLSDVQQKINNYDQALTKIGSTVGGHDQSNIAALIGKQTFKVGAFGSEVPVDRLNAALDKENISGLSDDAIKLLAAYYNARESLVGYNRVLSGSARGGEKQMELSLDTLPNPGTADPRYAKEGMNQFRQNLKIVGQGLPVIPGIKRPEEWSPTPGATGAPTASQGGDFWGQFPEHK